MNPLLTLTDLRAVAGIAHEHGALVLCDNTFATPLGQRPLALGCDLVVHSATKALSGHSDVVAGVVVGSAALVERIWKMSIVLGATPGPFDAWLVLRGLRTLPLRFRRHEENALAVALALADHPAVARVSYPGLPSHPQHDLARAQMSGYGSVLSFVARDGAAGARRFLDRVELITEGVSLGGFESLAMHPATVWLGTVGEEAAHAAGIDTGLVRICVGLEAPEDLVADVVKALS